MSAPISAQSVRLYVADAAHGGDPQVLNDGPYDSTGNLRVGSSGVANQREVVLRASDWSYNPIPIAHAPEVDNGFHTGHAVETTSPDRTFSINLTSVRELNRSAGTAFIDFLFGRHSGARSCFGPDTRVWGVWLKLEVRTPGGRVFWQVIGHCKPEPTLQGGDMISGSLPLQVIVPLWAKDVGGTDANRRVWERGYIYVGG